MPQVSVTTTPVIVAQPLEGSMTHLNLVHRDATNHIYLGFDANVSPTTGFSLLRNEVYDCEIKPYEALYACSSAGTVTVESILNVSPHSRHG